MSDCENCGEHALECSCARCEIDKAANRNIGCDAPGSRIKISLKPVESIPIPEKEIKFEVGYQSVVIDKMFGPQIFANLRITADPKLNTWLIERENINDGKWVEWVRIPGQLEFEFEENE